MARKQIEKDEGTNHLFQASHLYSIFGCIIFVFPIADWPAFSDRQIVTIPNRP